MPLILRLLKEEYRKLLNFCSKCLSQEIKAANYSTDNGNLVRIVNQRNTTRVTSLIIPEKVYLGGSYNIEECLIEPTVLTDVTWDDKVMQEEIFGPILPVMTFEHLYEAISAIKKRPKPLALYLFTNDENVKQRIIDELSFGGGCINDALVHALNGEFNFDGVGEVVWVLTMVKLGSELLVITKILLIDPYLLIQT